MRGTSSESLAKKTFWLFTVWRLAAILRAVTRLTVRKRSVQTTVGGHWRPARRDDAATAGAQPRCQGGLRGELRGQDADLP